MAFALQQVHAIEAKGFDLHNGFASSGSEARLGFWDIGDEEGISGSGIPFYVWDLGV